MDGNKLKELRESMNLSRKEFANRINMEVEDVKNFEEYSYEPTKYDVEKMAHALNMDEDSLKWKLNVDRKIDKKVETSDVGLIEILLGFAAVWGLGKLTRTKQTEQYEKMDGEEKEDDDEVVVSDDVKAVSRNQFGTITVESKSKDNSLIIVLGLFFLLFVFIGSILLSFHIKEKQAFEDGKISAGFYMDFKGENHEVVVEQLKVLGFTDIKLIDLDDAGIFGINDGKIDSISIGGNSTFDSIDYFYPDETVIISYH